VSPETLSPYNPLDFERGFFPRHAHEPLQLTESRFSHWMQKENFYKTVQNQASIASIAHRDSMAKANQGPPVKPFYKAHLSPKGRIPLRILIVLDDSGSQNHIQADARKGLALDYPRGKYNLQFITFSDIVADGNDITQMNYRGQNTNISIAFERLENIVRDNATAEETVVVFISDGAVLI
jgi:hypothetical protein